MQGEPVATTDRSIHDPEMLTIVASTSPAHGEDDIEDEEGISPPASTEVDDIDGGDFEPLTEYDGVLPTVSLENGEEGSMGEGIEEYREECEDMDMEVDAAGGIDVGVTGPVSL